jgi:hypothetical protein
MDAGRFTAILERARKRNAELLLKAAILVRDEHIKDISGSNPGGDNPAAKGEYPKKRTGATAASVIISPSTVGELMKTGIVRIGLKAGTRRPGALYHHGWLGTRDTLKKVRPQIKAILSGADYAS